MKVSYENFTPIKLIGDTGGGLNYMIKATVDIIEESGFLFWKTKRKTTVPIFREMVYWRFEDTGKLCGGNVMENLEKAFLAKNEIASLEEYFKEEK